MAQEGAAAGGGETFAVGARVEARWGGEAQWFGGNIISAGADGTYGIAYDDGDVEQGVARDMVRLAPAAPEGDAADEATLTLQGTGGAGGAFAVGAVVEARYGGGEEWYSGEITADNRDGTYALLYEDGDREAAVAAQHIRLVSEPTTAVRAPAVDPAPAPAPAPEEPKPEPARSQAMPMDKQGVLDELRYLKQQLELKQQKRQAEKAERKRQRKAAKKAAKLQKKAEAEARLRQLETLVENGNS